MLMHLTDHQVTTATSIVEMEQLGLHRSGKNGPEWKAVCGEWTHPRWIQYPNKLADVTCESCLLLNFAYQAEQ